MRTIESRYLWGVLLILAGVIFLAQNLGWFRLTELIWIIVFSISGGLFLVSYFHRKLDWWAIIPGITLISLAFLVVIIWIFPEDGAFWGGSIVLSGIGLSFFTVYLTEHQHWWALIPGGVLISLAVVAGFDLTTFGINPMGFFFIGLGLTFTLVAVLPNKQGDMLWAFIPSAILILSGMFTLLAGEDFVVFLWPAVLILFGGFLLLRAYRRA